MQYDKEFYNGFIFHRLQGCGDTPVYLSHVFKTLLQAFVYWTKTNRRTKFLRQLRDAITDYFEEIEYNKRERMQKYDPEDDDEFCFEWDKSKTRKARV